MLSEMLPPSESHWFTVPIDHALGLAEAEAQDAAGTGVGPHGRGTLTVFAREIRAKDDPGGERPWALYLQGGPGSAGPRPARRTRTPEPATTRADLLRHV